MSSHPTLFSDHEENIKSQPSNSCTNTLNDLVINVPENNDISENLDVMAIGKELDIRRKQASAELLKVLGNPYSSTDELNEAQSAANSAKARWVAFLSAQKTLDDISGEEVLKNLSVKRNAEDHSKNLDSFIPPNLPVFQLRGGLHRHPEKKVHESIRSFLNDFEVQLKVHNLPVDKHWERLFWLTCDEQQRVVFEKTKAGKGLGWKEAREQLEMEYGYPQYLWAKRLELKNLVQRTGEPVHVFAQRFMDIAMAAEIENGEMLSFIFISSLVKPIRERAWQIMIQNFGKSLPQDVNQVIHLIIDIVAKEFRSLEDVSPNGTKRQQEEQHRVVGTSKKPKEDPRFPRSKNANPGNCPVHPKGRHSREECHVIQNLDKGIKPQRVHDLCHYCHKVTYFQGHKCPEFQVARAKKAVLTSHIPRNPQAEDIVERRL